MKHSRRYHHPSAVVGMASPPTASTSATAAEEPARCGRMPGPAIYRPLPTIDTADESCHGAPRSRERWRRFPGGRRRKRGENLLFYDPSSMSPDCGDSATKWWRPRWPRFPPLLLPLLLLLLVVLASGLLATALYNAAFGTAGHKLISSSHDPSLPLPSDNNEDLNGSDDGVESEVWLINVEELRHSRQRRSILSTDEAVERDNNLRGLALDCGSACRIRMRPGTGLIAGRHPSQHHLIDRSSLEVEFTRLAQQRPDSNFSVPIVQYMDSAEETHLVSHPRASTLCIYTARIAGAAEESVVNLCDESGGLFGTLALPEGTFTVEPLLRRDGNSSGESREGGRSGKRSRRSADGAKRIVSRSRALRAHLITPIHFGSSHHPVSPSAPVSPLHHSNASFDSVTYTIRNGSIETGRRRKRAADSWDHFVEVMVVADYKMLVYHQGNLENYLLTLFSTVASIYRHPTLGASINIIVVRLVILKHERAGPRITNRAQETLQEFCNWQQQYNDASDESINHHDVAILLTRHDICRATHKCDTLGLAELGTMCDRHKSCAIIEDNGLSAAFTIAHELGHIFNLPHDDERKCGEYMALNKNNYHIMAPTLEYNTNPWSWSPCSAQMLGKFLDTSRGQTQCIYDKPVERRYFDKMYENPVPGAVYSVNEQCQFVFGAAAKICPYMPTCRRLWCSISLGFQMGCRTQHMPWADGTPCAENMWCHRGQCVGLSPLQRARQDGQWGQWNGWSECSRTCGGGVQRAYRECDNPRPLNGGKYCTGKRERYRSCNIHECPYELPGFRELQCADFNGRDVGIHGVARATKWLPKYTGIASNERCKLYCRVSTSAAFYLLKEKVSDGTPCDRNSDDICIDGACHPAGCDHRLDSPMRRDVCGICGGDGGSCMNVEGAYNERGSFGYNEVLKIPAGAANIDVSQRAHNGLKDDDNYLAIRSANGDFLLNGQYQVSVFRQQIPILDAVLEYSGSDQPVERINGSGPIHVDIHIHLLSVGNLNAPNIHYRYMISRPSPAAPGPKLAAMSGNSVNDARFATLPGMYYWRLADQWSECSARCQGSQLQRLTCVDAVNGKEVADAYCAGDKRPNARQRMCNPDCFYKWAHRTLSNDVRQPRIEVYCTRSYTNGAEERAHDEECLKAGLSRPVENRPTVPHFPAPPDRPHAQLQNSPQWHYTEWAECSETCGVSGVKRRSVHCVDAARRKLDPRHCEALPRGEPTETECNRVPCPQWVYGHWSECSRSCGGGIRIRHASCQDASGKELMASHCVATQKVDREGCNQQACTHWSFGPWSPCSATCGSGVMKRDARCVDESRVVKESLCAPSERIVEKPCEQPACPRWKLGTWSACSVSCLDGFMSRTVACVDGAGTKLPDGGCMKTRGALKPASHQSCSNGPCPYWRVGEWSKCSVSCGQGVRDRRVDCVYKEQAVDDSLCADHGLPSRHEQCSLLACAKWTTSEWAPCSVTCGPGTQRRDANCTRGVETLHETECSAQPRPKTERPCEKEPCLRSTLFQNIHHFRWISGPWGECSADCGDGEQKRMVRCLDESLRELPLEYCRHLADREPPNTRSCNLRPCTYWSVGPWDPCPATCGDSVVQKRLVRCEIILPSSKPSIEQLKREIKDSDCDPLTQPDSARACQLPQCEREPPKREFGRWEIGDWSQCSLSCGGGWRRRSVFCSSTQCPSEGAKPTQFEQCNVLDCPRGLWKAGGWSKCSSTCGHGVQTRDVWCESDASTAERLDDVKCVNATNDRPLTSRNCVQVACPTSATTPASSIADSRSRFQWLPGHWSACSRPCGRGTRTRSVRCVDILEPLNFSVADASCTAAERPSTEHTCRETQCPRWQRGKWGQCSASCGAGVSRREVFCQRGGGQRGTAALAAGGRVPDLECFAVASTKPFETKKCKLADCPVYRWRVSPWSKCTDPCKATPQYRRAYCMSNEGKRAANRMCANLTSPITNRLCPTNECPYQWVPGPWSTCSRTCGVGFHFRKIECRVKRHLVVNDSPVMNNTSAAAAAPPTVLSRMCLALEKPDVSRECTMNPQCDADHHWSVGPWSQCSKQCGQGYRRRKVRCLNRRNERVDRRECDRRDRPKRREQCFLRNCLPTDCSELNHDGEPLHDGNYTVLVAGFTLQIYCHAMNSSLPKSFLNVPPISNYAEFYPKRLAYPYSCPHNGKRNDSCLCSNDGHVAQGMSSYAKVRIDLQNLKINPNDFTFATTEYGSPVPYGTAGDCYSMSDCPQGRFSIDLRGTGLRVVDDLHWVEKGHRTSSRIDRTEDNAVVTGVCGGYCGECAPDRFKGLVVEVDRRQKSLVGTR